MEQEKLKLVTLHVVDKTQLEGTYTGRVARALDVLMLCAGHGGQMVHKDFAWQQCYVQGRTLLTPEEMQNRWPSEWQLIVEALMPGMPDLAEQVQRRGEHEPDTHERDMRNQVSVSLYLLTAFLHGSSVHLYNHATSPVFMALPLFREEWFRQWHREQFSPVVAELQMKAEAVSRHLTDINRCYNVLAKAREDLHLPHDFHQPISRDSAEQLLHHAYGLVSNTALPAASTKQPPSEQPAPLPPVPRTLNDLSAKWISESGLFELASSSKLPAARAFRKWVFGEVLPSIRKTGSYSVQVAPAAKQTDTWLDKRLEGKELMRLKNASLQELIAGGFGQTGSKLYAIAANHINQAVLGFTQTTTSFKKQQQLPRHISIPDILNMQGQVARCYAETCFQKFVSDNLQRLRDLPEADLIKEFAGLKLNLRQGFVSTGMGDLQGKLLTVAEAKKRKAEIGLQSRKQQKLLQAEQSKAIECAAA